MAADFCGVRGGEYLAHSKPGVLGVLGVLGVHESLQGTCAGGLRHGTRK